MSKDASQQTPDTDLPTPDTDAPSEITPEQMAAVIRDAHATNLQDVAGAVFIYASVCGSLTDKMSPAAFKLYRDRLLESAGSPTDPLEIMLIEQLALAHFSIGRLQLKSASAEHPKLAVAYADAATRLLGEFRRCTLALEDFRAKQASRKLSSKQASGHLKPAGRNGKPRQALNSKKEAPDTKLTELAEVPEWVHRRMGYANNGASKLAVGNGEG